MDDILYPVFAAASLVGKLAVNPIGLVLIVAGLACGIFRRPWYLAPLLAAIYTAVTIGYALSGLGHGSSSLNKSLEYKQVLFAYTVIALLAYGLGRVIGRRIAPGRTGMSSERETLLVVVLTIAAVVLTPVLLRLLLP